MSIRVTQIGLEVWVNNPGKLRTTQVGTEVWVNDPSNIRTTQVGAEVWTSILHDRLFVDWFSEPVWARKGSAPCLAPYLHQTLYQPVQLFSPALRPYDRLSEPVWPKKGLASHLQQPLYYPVQFFPPTQKTHEWLSEPLWPKKGLAFYLQQSLCYPVIFFNPIQKTHEWLSEPVWPKKGLRTDLNQSFVWYPKLVTPGGVTAAMSVLDAPNTDTGLFSINVYWIAPAPYVPIVEIDVTIKEIPVNRSAAVSLVEEE